MAQSNDENTHNTDKPMNTEHTQIDIDYSLMTATMPLPDGSRVRAKLQHDSDSGAPWKEWDGEGLVHVFERGSGVESYLAERFDGDLEAVYRALLAGDAVRDRGGNPCLGVEAYIHSGEAWYLPGGCQIDRQWDVTPMRALWTADADVLANIDGEPTTERLREYLRGCLTTFNQFLSGDVWCCEVSLERPTGDPEIWEADGDGDSCCGLYGEESIKSFVWEFAGAITA